jgi:hypothetical protein
VLSKPERGQDVGADNMIKIGKATVLILVLFAVFILVLFPSFVIHFGSFCSIHFFCFLIAV